MRLNTPTVLNMAKSIATEEKKKLLLNEDLIEALKLVPRLKTRYPYLKPICEIPTTAIQRKAVAKSIYWTDEKLETRIKSKKPLGYLESDKAWIVLHLYKFGTKLFGKEERFDNWMHSPCGALHDEIPYELIKLERGVWEVDQELRTIAAGAFA